METSLFSSMIEIFVDPSMKKFKMLDKTLSNCFDEVAKSYDYRKPKTKQNKRKHFEGSTSKVSFHFEGFVKPKETYKAHENKSKAQNLANLGSLVPGTPKLHIE